MPRTWWQPVIPGTAAISPWQRYSVAGCQWRRLTNKCWTFKTKTGLLVCLRDDANFHSASRVFLSLVRFWRTRERLCMNRVRSLLSMRGMLLGYSFEPRPSIRPLGIAYSVMTIGLSINGCSHSKKPVWRDRTRLTSPEVWAVVTSKAWRDSVRASFSPPHSRKQNEALAGYSVSRINVK